jgi:redox-sensing transcriptional repressor
MEQPQHPPTTSPRAPESAPNPAVRRLSLYLRQLEALRRGGRTTVSSKQLGESLGLTDAQVRKDLAYFGQFGHPGIGYRVDDLIAQVKRILGTDKTWNVILVGAGNLGRALSAYRGFEAKGFRPHRRRRQRPDQGRPPARPFTIQALADVAGLIERESVKLAILAVPAEFAQPVADQLIDAGVRGLMNFAPVSITCRRTWRSTRWTSRCSSSSSRSRSASRRSSTPGDVATARRGATRSVFPSCPSSRAAAPSRSPPPRTAAGDRTPRGGDRTPRGGDRIPRAGDRTPREGDRTPRGGDRMRRGGDRMPRAGDRTPRAGDRMPRGGDRVTAARGAGCGRNGRAPLRERGGAPGANRNGRAAPHAGTHGSEATPPKFGRGRFTFDRPRAAGALAYRAAGSAAGLGGSLSTMPTLSRLESGPMVAWLAS